MHEWEKAWLACAIDSEGSITEQTCDSRKPCRGCPHVKIEVNNTVQKYVDRAEQLVGDGHIRSKPNPPSNTPLFVWTLCKQKTVLQLLRDMLPYLIIRQVKAAAILDRYAKRPVPMHPSHP